MKKNSKTSDGMRKEYDFSNKMKGGVRGKYAKRYSAGTNLVLLDPEVYKAFPTSEAVNQTLRAALNITKTVRSSTRRKKSG
jgi:hypothetical protein